MSDQHGRVALVTGGSRGIGAATARRLAADGADVAITYERDEVAAKEVVRQIEAAGSRAVAIRADGTDPVAVRDAVRRTVTELGGLDILVNNAGVFRAAPIEELSLEDIDRMLALHVRAPIVAIQEALSVLPRGGRIISIGSNSAHRAVSTGMSVYAASKAALDGLTRWLARELGEREITVTAVHPGPTDTDMNPATGAHADQQRSNAALGRYSAAEDIADAVSYLAGARNVTGTALTVDGGVNA
ncbi:MAG TPA: SDR family oxidoreductase [Mycobacteriales bacterium]|nr:SDR family oxidoreductase [Mycobacteriales bacterium]